MPLIADRAYGTIKSTEHCLTAGGVIIRIKNKAFNIHDAGGRKLVFADWLRTAGETAEELNAYVRNSEKSWFPYGSAPAKKQKRKSLLKRSASKRRKAENR